MKYLTTKIILTASLVLLLYTLPLHANLRIMSYNIKDFWLRFDGRGWRRVYRDLSCVSGGI